MSFRTFVIASTSACLMYLASSARAGLILDPTAVSTNMGTFSGNINNVINQSGQNPPYISGVTDFGAYTASDGDPRECQRFMDLPKPCHHGHRRLHPRRLLRDRLLRHLGVGVYQWRQHRGFHAPGLERPLVHQHDHARQLYPNLFPGSPIPATVVNFIMTTASYVRLEITSNNGGPDAGFNEAAFGFEPSAVAEPSSLLMAGIEIVPVLSYRLRRCSRFPARAWKSREN